MSEMNTLAAALLDTSSDIRYVALYRRGIGPRPSTMCRQGPS